MRYRHILQVHLFAAAISVAIVQAEETPNYLLDAFSRQDLTGQGSFHRIGMFREQKRSVNRAADAMEETPADGSLDEGWRTYFTEKLSGQVRANTMLFYSDNILNTETDAISDGQLAEFLGVSLKWDFNEQWALNNTFDQAFFRHGKSENTGNDFNTSTFRQQLSYEKFFLNNKASFGLPLSWQYSDVRSRSGNTRLVSTLTYTGALELSFFPKPWLIPTFSYNYSFSDPDAGSGKHKHDFNLGVTFIPIQGTRLFIIPSVQFSHEDFKEGGRSDQAWTPTVTVSWSPLSFLAFDAVASYTDSESNNPGSSFDAMTGTLFARLFWNW